MTSDTTAELEYTPGKAGRRLSDNAVVFTGVDVLTAAKQRIRQMCSMFDTIVVSFSGGKDSMATMELVREVYDEIGWEDHPVKFFFYDEEVIQDDVIETVNRYMADPRFEGRYYAVPMESARLILGQRRQYIQWDRAREGNWVRPRPEHAVTEFEGVDVFYQNEINPLVVKEWGLKGRVAIVNGIRADESDTRLRSCLAVKSELNWINKPRAGGAHISFVKPIFDWSEKDIFAYFYQRGIKYAPIYDSQMLMGRKMRVATAVHVSNIVEIDTLRATYPKFYEQIVSIWPDVLTQERYGHARDPKTIMAKYKKGWVGLLQYCDEAIGDDEERAVAKQALLAAKKAKDSYRRRGKYSDTICFGMPFLDIWRSLMKGQYNNGFQINTRPTPEMIAFEEAALAGE